MAEENIPLLQARLAEWMGVSRPSVSEAIKRLTRDGLITANGRTLAFTKEGRRLARTLVDRHRLAEHFLIRILGLPWHRAHEEAAGWERVMTDTVERRIREILHDPPTCPHGNPIHGSKKAVDQSGLVPLPEVEPGQTVLVGRLTEDLELNTEVMRFFEDGGLMPGARVKIEGTAPDGTITLRTRGKTVALGEHLADNIWVQRAGGRK
jgi:DtxR family Mn-dependent transcriptional regulator